MGIILVYRTTCHTAMIIMADTALCHHAMAYLQMVSDLPPLMTLAFRIHSPRTAYHKTSQRLALVNPTIIPTTIRTSPQRQPHSTNQSIQLKAGNTTKSTADAPGPLQPVILNA